ncbi:MAG: lysophospholipid acyltransferase family protein [Limisphaerales bacterium]
MPHMKGRWYARVVIRNINLLLRKHVLGISGLEHIGIDKDPFILALNHSQKIEAPLVGSLLSQLREGKNVRFIADWNLLLVPGVAVVYRAGQVIILDRKPAKPNFLNVFRPWLTSKIPATERAAQLIDEGQSIGIYPEGTVNNKPDELLRGLPGAAALSISKQVPVVPAGIRFPQRTGDGPIRESDPFEVEFGPPLMPPKSEGTSERRAVRDFHHGIMREIARLSGKSWHAESSKRK